MAKDNTPERSELQEPHLVDLGSTISVAEWVAATALGAGIGLAATEGLKMAAAKVKDLLNRYRNEKGRSEVTQLKAAVIVLIRKESEQPEHTAELDLARATEQLDEIFSEYE